MVAREPGYRAHNRRHLVAAIPLLLVLSLLASSPASSQMPLQPELHIQATVNPHGERLGPTETGLTLIDVEITCGSPGVFMDPIDILFSFQTWPSFGIDVQPEFVETEVTFSPDECIGSSDPRTIFLEAEHSFTHGFYDPVEIELWAAHHGENHMVAAWGEPPGVHAEWKASLEQRGTIMVDTLIPMKGQVDNHGNVPIDVEVVIRHPPRLGTLNHPQGMTIADDGGSENFHLEYSADRLGQEQFTVLLHAITADESSHMLETHVAQFSFDVVERQTTIPVGLDDTRDNLADGTFLLLVLAGGAVALLAWRKNHRPPGVDARAHQAPEDQATPLVMEDPAKMTAPSITSSSGPNAFHVKQARAPEG